MAKVCWEFIGDGCGFTVYRSRVPNSGWLVKNVDDVRDEQNDVGYQWRTTMTFVPDVEGLWLKEVGLSSSEYCRTLALIQSGRG